MSFSPTVTHASKVVPGVRFTVHRMGYARRVELDRKTLDLRQRLRELEVDNPPQTPLEVELSEQIAIARRKAIAVPESEADLVVAKELLPLLADLRKAQERLSPEIKKRRLTLHEEYGQIESQIRVAWVKDGLISIEGGEVDGMSASQLLDSGPEDLAIEIYEKLATDGRLSGAQSKNSHLPTTSGAPVGGEATASIAPNAEPPAGATTYDGTASATSPPRSSRSA